MKILLTGPPKIGKTTLIRRVAEQLTRPYAGFYSEEILKQGQRVGFAIRTFYGQIGVLSHIEIKSGPKIGKYGVNLTDLEQIALPEIEEGIKQKKIILIDEIGKMELFSEKFKNIVMKILDSDSCLLGTIIYASHPWADRLKTRPNAELVEVTEENRERLVSQLAEKLNPSGK
jgi:nucleoside-triphosphatase